MDHVYIKEVFEHVCVPSSEWIPDHSFFNMFQQLCGPVPCTPIIISSRIRFYLRLHAILHIFFVASSMSMLITGKLYYLHLVTQTTFSLWPFTQTFDYARVMTTNHVSIACGNILQYWTLSNELSFLMLMSFWRVLQASWALYELQSYL